MSNVPEDSAYHPYADVARQVMRRQAALGLRVSAIFLVLIIGLPLFNQRYPEVAATPVFGFPVTWLLLGVAFFPITWLLSAYFVRESDRIESEAAGSIVTRTPAAGGNDDPADGLAGGGDK